EVPELRHELARFGSRGGPGTVDEHEDAAGTTGDDLPHEVVPHSRGDPVEAHELIGPELELTEVDGAGGVSPRGRGRWLLAEERRHGGRLAGARRPDDEDHVLSHRPPPSRSRSFAKRPKVWARSCPPPRAPSRCGPSAGSP